MFAAVLAASGQSAPSSTATNEIPKVKAGGIDLILPSPKEDITEVGDRLRTTVFDLLTPSSNRLLTAYLSPQMQQNLLKAIRPPSGLGLYGMVEIPRAAEYTDVGPQDFEQAVNTVTTSLGTSIDKALSNTTDEINARVKQLGGKPIAIDHPEMVGSLFRKPESIGWAMLMGIRNPDTGASATMVVVTAMIYVKHRVLFVYLYGTYESPETVDSLGKLADAWASRILSANVPAKE